MIISLKLLQFSLWTGDKSGGGNFMSTLSKGSVWFFFLIFGGPVLLSFQNCGKGFQAETIAFEDLESKILQPANIEEDEPAMVQDQAYSILSVGAVRGQDVVIQIEKLGQNKTGFIQVITQDLTAKANVDYMPYAATLTFEAATTLNIKTNAEVIGSDAKKFVLVLTHTDEEGQMKHLMKTIVIRSVESGSTVNKLADSYAVTSEDISAVAAEDVE